MLIDRPTFTDAATECAYFVWDSEYVQEGYHQHIQDGHDPREHMIYYAAIVLNKTDLFEDDIKEYLEEINNA